MKLLLPFAIIALASANPGYRQVQSVQPAESYAKSAELYQSALEAQQHGLYSGQSQLQQHRDVAYQGVSTGEKNAKILDYKIENDGHGYQYQYETDNGIKAQEISQTIHGTQVQGGYSYTGDDGQVYTVTYTADENGFRASGAHIPTPPPIPEAIAKSLEQNAEAEANGVFDDGKYKPEAEESYQHYEDSHQQNTDHHISAQPLQQVEQHITQPIRQIKAKQRKVRPVSHTQHQISLPVQLSQPVAQPFQYVAQPIRLNEHSISQAIQHQIAKPIQQNDHLISQSFQHHTAQPIQQNEHKVAQSFQHLIAQPVQQNEHKIAQTFQHLIPQPLQQNEHKVAQSFQHLIAQPLQQNEQKVAQSFQHLIAQPVQQNEHKITQSIQNLVAKPIQQNQHKIVPSIQHVVAQPIHENENKITQSIQQQFAQALKLNAQPFKHIQHTEYHTQHPAQNVHQNAHHYVQQNLGQVTTEPVHTQRVTYHIATQPMIQKLFQGQGFQLG